MQCLMIFTNTSEQQWTLVTAVRALVPSVLKIVCLLNVFVWSHSSSEYSDWTADAGISGQHAMSFRRRARRKISSSEEEKEDNTIEDEQTEQTQDEDAQSLPQVMKKRAKSKTPKVKSSWNAFSFKLKFHVNLNVTIPFANNTIWFTRTLMPDFFLPTR